ERRREYGREWMRRNADKARDAMRRWRAAHPEQHRAARDGWDRANPTSATARRLRYRIRHPEVRRVIEQTRRAREPSASGSFTSREWLELVAQYAGRCAYCGGSEPLQQDHRI